MKLKKFIALGAACAILSAALVVPASAHGGNHRASSTGTRYAVCTVAGCTTAGSHAHNGVTYCGTSHASGNHSGRHH